MKIAYADPPYPGQAKKHYGPDAREVNHRLLVEHLQGFDGWALSTTSVALIHQAHTWGLPEEVRVGSWVKPFASFKPNVNPAYAWEPVIFVPARHGDREKATVRDWVAASITLKKGVSGAKPSEFCRWLFDLLGADPEDEFHDLFPGSGAVTTAWEAWRRQKNAEQETLALTHKAP